MSRGERLKYYLYLAAVYPIAFLPFRALYLLSDCLYFLLYRVMRYRIKVVRANLASSFPDMSPRELKKVERDFYHSLCDIIVETIKLLHISDRQLRKRVEVTNPEIIAATALPATPVILYLAHYGNWEWVTAITQHFDYNKIYPGHIYKAMHDRSADALMAKIRSRLPSHGLEIKSCVRELLRIGREHPAMIIGFISDHRFNSVPRHQSTMFLNHDTPYYIGGEGIGRKLGAKYLYLDVEKPKRGHYRLTYIPITETDIGDDGPNPITRQYYRMLEQTIRRNPGLWLWSHRRWI